MLLVWEVLELQVGVGSPLALYHFFSLPTTGYKTEKLPLTFLNGDLARLIL